jgi:hypothetical protein
MKKTLLTPPCGNTKTNKSLALGYANYILHLAPANTSGRNVCPGSSKGCRAACLNFSGRGQWLENKQGLNPIHKARIEKTKYFFNDRGGFLDQLRKEINLAINREIKRGLVPVFRLNGTSDIRFENYGIFESFPDIQFYDYTKLSNRRNLPGNYKLTFSRSESNQSQVKEAFSNGMNVAAAFRDELPPIYRGIPVINGDLHDLRFLDPAGVYVGLIAKGPAKKDKSGFVIDN